MAETRVLENVADSAGCETMPCGPELMWIYPDRLRKLLDFTGMSYSALAKKSGVPDGTIRKLLQGDTRDPRVSTLVPILKASGADANIVLGLAPPRDYDKELNREGTKLAEALQRRVEDGETELARLRKLVLEKGERMSAAEGRVKSLEYMVDKRDETIRQQTETIAQYECRMEIKRDRIEKLEREIGQYRASKEADNRTVGNLEGMCKRHRKVQQWLFGLVCVFAIAAFAVSFVFAREMSDIETGMTGRQLQQYLEQLDETKNP